VRVFRDDKIVFTGDPAPLDFSGQTDLQHLTSGSRLQIGSAMTPGNYVFQIIVTDNSNHDKPRVASQWIDFEVIK